MSGPRGGRPAAPLVPALPALALGLLGALACAPQAAAQQAGAEGADPLASDTTSAVAPMPDTPRVFRVGARLSAYRWPDEAGRNEVADAVAGGLELELLARRWLGFRLGLDMANTSITAPDGDAEASVRQYVAELLMAGRLPLAPLQRLHLTPWVEVGVGTVVHDPDEGGATRTQNMAVYGAGIDWDPLARVGLRAGWRGMTVKLGNPLVADDLEAATVTADRLTLSLHWRF